MNTSDLFIGIDGCQTGWISVALYSKTKWEIEIYSSIIDIWKNYSNADLILIDIPIGLRESGSKARLCDIEARIKLTRKRSSSVFPTPCRSVLFIDTYEKANEINRKLTRKGLSKQTWNITPKIKDVDTFLQKNKELNQIIIESHPELCFMALADGIPLDYYKKKKEGIKERKDLLRSYFQGSDELIDEGLEKFDNKDVDLDDLLDAFVLALSATVGKKKLIYIPEEYEYDSKGLPMRMAIPSFK